MKLIAILFLIISFSTCVNSQKQSRNTSRLAGGLCEGCEAILEYGNRKLLSVDTLPDFNDAGTRIKLTGTVYLNDGKTPAKEVIVYIYHTDQKGIYAAKDGETGWAKRHGYIRGWIKTGTDGKYTFYTLKPGIYPDRSSPAHIHVTIMEPDGKYYWLGSYHFEGDPLLTKKEIAPELPRGGSSGLLVFRKEETLLVGQRDIILGKNVSDYK